MKLRDTSFLELIKARVKKMMLDMTSVKFQFVIFVGLGIWDKKIEPYLGLPVIMVTLGIKEYVDFIGKKVDNGK